MPLYIIVQFFVIWLFILSITFSICFRVKPYSLLKGKVLRNRRRSVDVTIDNVFNVLENRKECRFEI